MAKRTKAEQDDQLDPAEAQRRMDEAVRRMLSTKPETHEEMVERKHRKGEIKPRKKSSAEQLTGGRPHIATLGHAALHHCVQGFLALPVRGHDPISARYNRRR